MYLSVSLYVLACVCFLLPLQQFSFPIWSLNVRHFTTSFSPEITSSAWDESNIVCSKRRRNITSNDSYLRHIWAGKIISDVQIEKRPIRVKIYRYFFTNRYLIGRLFPVNGSPCFVMNGKILIDLLSSGVRTVSERIKSTILGGSSGGKPNQQLLQGRHRLSSRSFQWVILFTVALSSCQCRKVWTKSFESLY